MQFKIILVHLPVVLVQLPGTRSCGARVDVVLRPAYDARSTLLLLLRTWYCSATATLLSCRAFICTKGKCEKMLKPRMKAAPLPIAAVRVKPDVQALLKLQQQSGLHFYICLNR